MRGLHSGVAIKWATQKEQQHPGCQVKLVDQMVLLTQAWESKREDLAHRASWRVRVVKKA